MTYELWHQLKEKCNRHRHSRYEQARWRSFEARRRHATDSRRCDACATMNAVNTSQTAYFTDSISRPFLTQKAFRACNRAKRVVSEFAKL